MKKTLLLALSLGFARLLAVDSPPTEVVQLDRAKIDAAFAKGGSLLANTHYKVMFGHRNGPGIVEVHDHDTDLFYIVEGTATFVTGGTVVDPKTTGAGEVRGKAITGGDTHHLTKGDVIVIPKGVPHWFTAIPGDFVYYVVKVTE